MFHKPKSRQTGTNISNSYSSCSWSLLPLIDENALEEKYLSEKWLWKPKLWRHLRSSAAWQKKLEKMKKKKFLFSDFGANKLKANMTRKKIFEVYIKILLSWSTLDLIHYSVLSSTSIFYRLIFAMLKAQNSIQTLK